MERALSAHVALFLILVVVAVFTGLLIYLGRLKRPTVLEVCRFLQPLDTQRILDLKRDLRSCWEPTLWHYRELKETLRELRRWFSMLQFDLRLLIAWTNSQLHMELVEKPWEKEDLEDPPTEAERILEQQELERFTAGHRKLLAAACALQRHASGAQLRLYLWLIFRCHWFLPFPIPNVSDLMFKTRRSGQNLFFLYLIMARAAVDLGGLYDSTGGVSGVQSCFQEAFMNFRKPEPAATSLD